MPVRTSGPRVARINATGTRPKLVTTKAGDVELAIPKLRHGSFFPSILERRRRIDRALFAVVMEAYVHGVSTRKVDDLVAALGAASGISKSEVSPHLRRARRVARGVPGPAPRSCRVPVRVPGRHLRQGPSRRPDRLEGGDSGHRRVTAAVTGKSSASRSATPKTARSGPRSSAACAPEVSPASSS